MVVDWLFTAALVIARVGSVVMVMPAFRTMGVPAPLRLAVAMGLTTVLVPAVPQAVPTGGLGTLLAAMGGEVLIGLVMGGTVAVAFEAFALAAELMGMQMGLRMASLFDPLSRTQTGPLANLCNWLGTLVFLGTDLHLYMLSAVGDSFRALPPGGATDPLAAGALWVPVVGMAISHGVRLAGPVLALVFLVQVFLAVLVRLAPSMNVFFAVGLVITVAAGLLVFRESLPVLLPEHLEVVREAMSNIRDAANLAR